MLGGTSGADAVTAVVEGEHGEAAAGDAANDRRPIREVAAVAVEIDDQCVRLRVPQQPRAKPLAIAGRNSSCFERAPEVARGGGFAAEREEGEPRLEQADEDE